MTSLSDNPTIINGQYIKELYAIVMCHNDPELKGCETMVAIPLDGAQYPLLAYSFAELGALYAMGVNLVNQFPNTKFKIIKLEVTSDATKMAKAAYEKFHSSGGS